DASFNKDLTPFWNSFFLVSHFYDEDSFNDLNSNTIIKNSLWTTHIRATNNFTFLKDKSLFADITYSFLSPRVLGNSRIESYSKLGVSVRKTFWNKAASVSLAIEDIFNNNNRFATRNYLDQNNSTFTRVENRLFVFGFRYKFGNMQIKDNQKNKDTDENKRI
ncbi:MAG: outer membrane beta-barrel protein, partial [Maribacter sp.]